MQQNCPPLSVTGSDTSARLPWQENKSILLVVLLIGVALRFLLPLRGFNFDFESYTIVAELMSQGQNVYAHTTRYNYGPIWFGLLGAGHGIADLAPDPMFAFRYFVVGLLTLVDVGICLILCRRFGLGAAAIFFLNPITIIITGYHNQFGNLAILLGLVATLLLERDIGLPNFPPRQWFGLAVLALSLMTKHLLFFFPFWLAVKQPGLWRKVAVVLLPYLLFALSFLPFLFQPAGRAGIFHNVLMYGSFDNKLFHRLFLPAAFEPFVHSDILWLGLLALFALLSRRQAPLNALLLYVAVLVATAPATTNQYLALPMSYLAVAMNPFFAAYTLVGGYYLLIHKNGLHLYALDVRPVENEFYYSVCIVLLTLGIVWSLWQPHIRRAASWLWVEVKLQLEGKA